MMDFKENESSSPSQVKISSPEGPPPTLKERMQCLIKLRSAWDTDDTPSPTRPHSRLSINPSSGQVKDMKAKLARLAEELRCRDEEDEKLRNKPQWSLTTQTAAEKEIEAKKHRWTPPSSPKASTSSGTLKFRSPSPSRAEMPNSPRGGGSGSVERPNRTPVSARTARWEEHIAASKVGVSSRPPALPRTPISWQKKESAAQLEHSSRKESLRRHRERQKDMKYEAGLAAVGFDLSPVKTPTQRSQSSGKETAGVKRKKEEDMDEFKRPPASSLYRIISQPSEKCRDAVAEKKARMLNLMIPYSFGQTHSSEESTPESENFSDTNSLFQDEAPPGPKLNTLMLEMWRAERRASCEETMTEVTTATNTESDLDEDNDLTEQSDASPIAPHPAARRISLINVSEDNLRTRVIQEETPTRLVDEDEARREMAVEEEVQKAPKEEQEVQRMLENEEEVQVHLTVEEEIQKHLAEEEEIQKHLAVEEEVQRQLIADEEVQGRIGEGEDNQGEADVIDEAQNDFGVQEEDLTTVSDFEMRESDVSRTDEVMEDLEETGGKQGSENAHYDSETRMKFLQVMGQRPQTPAMGRVSIGRNVRSRRRSSSLSDLRSPCLMRPSYSGKTNSRERGNLAYTVENYRTTVLEGRVSPPAPRVYAMNFSDVDRPLEEDKSDRMVIGVQPRLDAKRIANLKQQASQQEEVIYQATKALHQVMANGRVGSAQHIECSRVLVVACQKRQALLEEAGRLRHGLLPLVSSSSSCVLTLSGVRLVLKEEFRLRVLDEQHHFLCLLRVPGGRVVSTAVGGSGSRDWVDIPSCLTVKDLEQGFRVSLEVYGLSLTRQPGEKARGLLQRLRRRGEEEVRWTAHAGFSLLASVSLSADSQGQSVFPLRHLPASSPLMPLVQLRLRVNSEPRIELRGFLNVFAEVGGFGSWLRRWCSLRRDALLMWSYPEEEAAGLPASHALSLRHCVSRRVELTSREECARPNTLRLFTLRQAGEADVDSLVVTRRADCVLEKCLISAESKKDEIEWADSLNDCLFLMRQLHAEQFRALEVKAKSLFNFV